MTVLTDADLYLRGAETLLASAPTPWMRWRPAIAGSTTSQRRQVPGQWRHVHERWTSQRGWAATRPGPAAKRRGAKRRPSRLFETLRRSAQGIPSQSGSAAKMTPIPVARWAVWDGKAGKVSNGVWLLINTWQ